MNVPDNQPNPDAVVRKLVVPETQPTAEYDDRSPKKDRDLTLETAIAPSVEGEETVRRLITLDDLQQQEQGDDDRSPKKDRDLPR